MSVQAILAPVFVQVLFTFGLLFWMGRMRFAAVRAGEVKVRDIALGQRVWPPKVMQVANTFHNQLETPVLFYTVVALALITRQADLIFVLLSWLYVAMRFVHAFVYTTSNIVIRRFQCFMVGTIVLMALWVYFAAKIFLALPG